MPEHAGKPLKPGFLPQVREMYRGEATDAALARGARLALAIERRRSRVQFWLNTAYYSVVGLALAWIFAMAIDREAPVQIGTREILNPGGQVRQGERLLVRSIRRRLRSCELSRRWSIIDGDGRRYDYEPDRFDAYGPVTPPDEQPEPETTGPIVPLNAVPGRGRWIIALAWECNMLQHAISWPITQLPPPLEFEILPRESRP